MNDKEDKDELFFDKDPDTANFVIEEQTEEENDRDTTVDIQLTILNGLRIDPDLANENFVSSFEITQGNLYFRVNLPSKKHVMRRQEHF